MSNEKYPLVTEHLESSLSAINFLSTFVRDSALGLGITQKKIDECIGKGESAFLAAVLPICDKFCQSPPFICQESCPKGCPSNVNINPEDVWNDKKVLVLPFAKPLFKGNDMTKVTEWTRQVFFCSLHHFKRTFWRVRVTCIHRNGTTYESTKTVRIQGGPTCDINRQPPDPGNPDIDPDIEVSMLAHTIIISFYIYTMYSLVLWNKAVSNDQDSAYDGLFEFSLGPKICIVVLAGLTYMLAGWAFLTTTVQLENNSNASERELGLVYCLLSIPVVFAVVLGTELLAKLIF